MFDSDRDNMILILMEELDPSNVPPRLRIQMERQTYIEWPGDNEVGQHLFWAKLNQSLSRPVTRFTIDLESFSMH